VVIFSASSITRSPSRAPASSWKTHDNVRGEGRGTRLGSRAAQVSPPAEQR
jgi:hypothetical protein